VSSLGSIRGLGGPLEPVRDEYGRRHVELHGVRVAVATVVLEAFDRIRPYSMEACHGWLGTVSDAVTNLRWDTHAANMGDRRKGRKETEAETYQLGPRPVSEAGQQ
jgi:hypothetical protein